MPKQQFSLSLKDSLANLGFREIPETSEYGSGKIASAIYNFCEGNAIACEPCRKNFHYIGKYCQGADGKPVFPNWEKGDHRKDHIPRVIEELKEAGYLARFSPELSKPENVVLVIESIPFRVSGSRLWENAVREYVKNIVLPERIDEKYFARLRKAMSKERGHDMLDCIFSAL